MRTKNLKIIDNDFSRLLSVKVFPLNLAQLKYIKFFTLDNDEPVFKEIFSQGLYKYYYRFQDQWKLYKVSNTNLDDQIDKISPENNIYSSSKNEEPNLDEEIIITADKLDPKSLKWLVYPYISYSNITVLHAEAGISKTMFAIFLSAKLSRGDFIFPFDNENNYIGNRRVLYITWEDDIENTILPRFIACEGVRANLYVFKEKLNTIDTFSDPCLIDYLNQIKPNLVVFDALSSFLGSINSNDQGQVKQLFKPLLTYLEKNDTACLIVAHNNKDEKISKSIHKLSGSQAIMAIARSSLTINIDKDHEDYRIIAQDKNNLEKLGASLKFKILEKDISYELGKDEEFLVPYLEFVEVVDLSADELIEIKTRVPSKFNVCKNDLYSLLKENNGYCEATKITELLSKKYSTGLISKAKNALQIQSKRINHNNKKRSYWFFKEKENELTQLSF